MENKTLKTLLILALLLQSSQAGPIAVGICYAGCGILVTACFGAAGFTFGTVPGSQIAAVPALTACNSAFSTCMAACSAAVIAPTP